MREERYQKLARSGKKVTVALRMANGKVRLSIQENKAGTLIKSVRRARLENSSAPGPSAGRTPSLIEGDCHSRIGVRLFQRPI
jgi:hypothetical protein